MADVAGCSMLRAAVTIASWLIVSMCLGDISIVEIAAWSWQLWQPWAPFAGIQRRRHMLAHRPLSRRRLTRPRRQNIAQAHETTVQHCEQSSCHQRCDRLDAQRRHPHRNCLPCLSCPNQSVANKSGATCPSTASDCHLSRLQRKHSHLPRLPGECCAPWP